MRLDMGTKNFAICLLVLISFSAVIMINRVVAVSDELNLPSTPVALEASNSTKSYINTTLSNVPSGYVVTNGTYLGWCVDKSANASLGVIYQVMLYSSINPPSTLADERWNMINYVLNHKQGTNEDIQQAIWYFVNMEDGYTPTRTVSWAIVNDALANGKGFVPTHDQTVAVICDPVNQPAGERIQITIVELSNAIVPEFPSIAIPLLMFALATLSVAAVYRKKYQKTPFSIL